ncbi:hypothetical protein NW768_003037 [Fusarium equiseti]|uniref:Uncharacterized protein n=1 Tax=Fusarium equiseti TaxID=61235 RepID=A0ABQ8RLJ0_FUSEQ|nr:hypothetical protein NW768_003037 [Fusarium equiseti]
MMTESAQTSPGGPLRLDHAVSMVTELAALDERDVIHGRQIYQDCGFFQYDDNPTWQTWLCVDTSSSTTTTCKTINDNFGCFTWMPTTCFASTESSRCNSLDKKQLCCTDPTFAECLVAKKTVGTETITAHVCANQVIEVSIYESTDLSTSTVDEETSSEETSREGTSSTGTGSSSSIEIIIQTQMPTLYLVPAPGKDAESNNTPVGPIVGGFIGGLALIAFVGLGVWFILRKTHNSGTVPSHGHYHPQSQSSPNHDYASPGSASPQYNHPPMASTQGNESQHFSNLPYMASPQIAELPSPPTRPKTPEL